MDTILRPNLFAILLIELILFLQVRQPSLLHLESHLISPLQAFFTKHIFPIGNSWITTCTKTAFSEFNNQPTLNICSSTLSRDNINFIEDIIKLSSAINPEVCLDNMMMVSKLFTCNLPFNLEGFLPQWWLGVREKWNENLNTYIETKMSSSLLHKPTAGFFNFTAYKFIQTFKISLSKA